MGIDNLGVDNYFDLKNEWFLFYLNESRLWWYLKISSELMKVVRDSLFFGSKIKTKSRFYNGLDIILEEIIDENS